MRASGRVAALASAARPGPARARPLRLSRPKRPRERRASAVPLLEINSCGYQVRRSRLGKKHTPGEGKQNKTKHKSVFLKNKNVVDRPCLSETMA